MPNGSMLDKTVFTTVNAAEERIENALGCDVIYFYGGILAACVNDFRSLIENLARLPDRRRALSICLTTSGGEVEVVEKLTEITRHHYPDEVNFIVPSAAFSAGTIFCMSGDRLWMDYSSSLGPIDPQVPDRDDQFLVPALGYLDKVDELIAKSHDESISPIETVILLKQDLARLRLYEQSRDLSVDLIRKWLVQYKFKDWKRHQTINAGAEVTLAEKEARAEEIAAKLSSNRIWHSHSRMIGMNTLRSVLRLQIDDFGSDREFAGTIRMYSDTLVEYLQNRGFDFFLYNRRFQFIGDAQ